MESNDMVETSSSSHINKARPVMTSAFIFSAVRHSSVLVPGIIAHPGITDYGHNPLHGHIPQPRTP
eukprot:CCRYP_012896-RC/>CCRYP_012896-RC protein AED:0.47 eAED:1.00 QI:0/0/0/1/0/0/2/0/65